MSKRNRETATAAIINILKEILAVQMGYKFELFTLALGTAIVSIF